MAGSQWWRRLPPVPVVGAALLAGAAPTPAYRYCQPPPGQATAQPPARVDHNIRVVNGESPPIDDATGERPPQAQLVASLGAFTVPAGAVSIRVVIECAPPPTVLPPDGTLDGNVYSFTVSAGATPLSLAPGQQATVFLRGPAGTPNPVLERYESGQWMRLPTRQVGAIAPDTYSATVDDLAAVALVVSNATVPVATGDDHTGLILAIFAAALALFAAGSLVVMRGRAGSARRGADS
jgi:hypothetical protein